MLAMHFVSKLLEEVIYALNATGSSVEYGEHIGLQSLINDSQSETQPVPNNLMRDASEIPIFLTLGSEEVNPTIPQTRAHFLDP